jgi:hypothetical protein
MQLSAARMSRRFEFEKRRQLFIGAHNEAPSIIAMRVHDPDCPPLTINRWRRSTAPTGFAEIVSDDFPILHPVPGNRTHDYVGRFELRIRVRERQLTLDPHSR